MDNNRHSGFEGGLCSCLTENGVVRVGYFISLMGFVLYLIMILELPGALKYDGLTGKYEDSTDDLDGPKMPAKVLVAKVKPHDVLMVLSLIMSILSIFLLMGLMRKQVIYFYPWLIMSIITVAVGTVCVILFTDRRISFISSLVLLLNTIAWYPIFYILQKFRSNLRLPGQQQELGAREMHPLNASELYLSTPPPAPTAPYRTATAPSCIEGGDPPSYYEVMGSSAAYPYAGCSTETPVVGWKIPEK